MQAELDTANDHTCFKRTVRIDLKSARVTTDNTSFEVVDPLQQYMRVRPRGAASVLAAPMDPGSIHIHGHGWDLTTMDAEVAKLVDRVRSRLTDENGQPLGRKRLWQH